MSDGRRALSAVTDGLIHITIPVGMLQCNCSIIGDPAAAPKRISVKDEAGDEIAIEELLNETTARDTSQQIAGADEPAQIVPHAPQLFSGDTLFAGSIGRADLWGGPMEQIMESLRAN